MNRRPAFWMFVFSFALVAASAAWAQEVENPPAPAPQEEPADQEEFGEYEPLYIKLGAGYVGWVTDMDFEVSTSTEAVEISNGGLQGLEIFGLYEFDEEWAVRLGVEFLWGFDADGYVGSLGAVYTPFEALEEPMDLHLRASLLFGKIDVEDVYGDFDPGVGIDIGVGVSYGLDEVAVGLKFEAEVMLRYLKFDFDKDANVVTSDDEVGGLGARFLAGLSYSF